MPLFMDIHKLPDDVKPEDLEQAHSADLAAQEKFGVRFHGYWYDHKGRTVACLIEGSDAEACDAVHKHAHGLVAEKIVAVSPETIQQFLGDSKVPAFGDARRADGSHDSGVRVVVFTEVDNLTAIGMRHGNDGLVRAMNEHDTVVRAALAKHGGREVRHTDEGIMASFALASAAVQCGLDVQEQLGRGPDGASPVVRIGIAAGEPVNQSDRLFGVAVDQARLICRAAKGGEVVVSSAVRELCGGKGIGFATSASLSVPGIDTPLELAAARSTSNATITELRTPAPAATTTSSGSLDALCAALESRYVLERELGRGGMATVFLAKDIRHDRHVAIKVLAADVIARSGTDRFLNEIRLAARLTHPNIVALFDSGEAGGLPFYVMPHVEGETLRTQLSRYGQLPVERAVTTARIIAGALAYAHRQGIVHRDIKPENLLMPDDQPLVLDFGIALALKEVVDERLTQPGLTVGTPSYMSPEQVSGDREIDARSDIYALGCVLYEMLAGQPPFSGGLTQALFARILTDAPVSIKERRPEVPGHVAKAIDCALAKAPESRFSSASEFASALAGRSAS